MLTSMESRVLLITPPFTQLNTPYPATAYLKGFLNTLNIPAFQADLGIEVILELFTIGGLEQVFEQAEYSYDQLDKNLQRIVRLRESYISSIEPTIAFLQHKNPTLAHAICSRSYLPEAKRFEQIEDLEWAFGSMGIHDKARHFATLFLEDLGDLIQVCTDPHFGFSRYAERLGRTASSLSPIIDELEAEETLITSILLQLLEHKLEDFQPTVVCISVPFPGNLFGALKCGQFIKATYPSIKVILGGGYANTELRSLADERLFDYLDFVSLDDGEAPLQILLEYIEGKRKIEQLKRVFHCEHGVVQYCDNAPEKDIAQRETGTPDYSDLLLNEYVSVIEIVNPMHRLWSDGRWNKLTLAHGCYWGKCSFCDISLDYIQRYEPIDAKVLCDRIETIIEQTGQNGFHFVDEAAPPALMRDLAIEILRRKLTIVWWTNIRFEKSFTTDLCKLLKASGCIAVSGGLEVASDRLLKLMKKGVTVAQVARVAEAFTQAGILVHSYLMYGFPTQTDQETIDALEMVRQLFEQNIVQSGFWHRFAMTAHSPVGLEPAAYQVTDSGPNFEGFADNDRYHEDPLGTNHDLYSEGLRKSLFNYMHGVCLQNSLDDWFNFPVPPTSIPSNYIELAVSEQKAKQPRQNALLLWPGELPLVESYSTDYDDGTQGEVLVIHLTSKNKSKSLEFDAEFGSWIAEQLTAMHSSSEQSLNFQALTNAFEAEEWGSTQDLLESELWEQLIEAGLLIV